MDRQLKQLQRLATAAIGLTLVVVLLGGWTRLNDAGLGCPDWPGCYGSMVLPADPVALEQAQALYPERQIDQYKGWLEMVHRYAAGTLGLLIAVIAVQAVRIRALPGVPVRLAAGLLVLVTVQAMFGMWTVTLKLLPQVVTLHLLGGLLTLTLLVRLRHRLQALRQPETDPVRKNHWVAAALLLLFIQLALGGWTSANYAGWACTDWLQCNSDSDIALDYAGGFSLAVEIGPDYEGGLRPVEARAAIQVAHRWMAVLLMGYLTWLSFRYWQGRAALMARVLVAVTTLQVLLGIANVVWALPLALATAHHAGAVLLLLSLLWLYENSGNYPQEVRDEPA